MQQYVEATVVMVPWELLPPQDCYCWSICAVKSDVSQLTNPNGEVRVVITWRKLFSQRSNIDAYEWPRAAHWMFVTLSPQAPEQTLLSKEKMFHKCLQPTWIHLLLYSPKSFFPPRCSIPRSSYGHASDPGVRNKLVLQRKDSHDYKCCYVLQREQEYKIISPCDSSKSKQLLCLHKHTPNHLVTSLNPLFPPLPKISCECKHKHLFSACVCLCSTHSSCLPRL